MAASITTAEPVLDGVSTVVAIQAVAEAKGSNAGGGGSVGADEMEGAGYAREVY
jgi:hypothetical protein